MSGRRPNLDDEFSSYKLAYFGRSAAVGHRPAGRAVDLVDEPPDVSSATLTFIRIGFKDVEDAKGRRNHDRRTATALHKRSCFFCCCDGKRVMGGKSGSLWTTVA